MLLLSIILVQRLHRMPYIVPFHSPYITSYVYERLKSHADRQSASVIADTNGGVTVLLLAPSSFNLLPRQ